MVDESKKTKGSFRSVRKVRVTRKRSQPASPENPDSHASDPIQSLYGSMSACSASTKIPLTLLQLAKRSGCAGFDGSGRVRLAPVLEWIFSQNDDAKKNWHEHGKKFDALLKEVQFQKASDAVMDRAEVVSGIQTCTAKLFSELDRRFLNELPPSLVGLSEIAIRAKSNIAIEELKQKLREEFGRLALEKETKQ